MMFGKIFAVEMNLKFNLNNLKIVWSRLSILRAAETAAAGGLFGLYQIIDFCFKLLLAGATSRICWNHTDCRPVDEHCIGRN